MEKKKLFCEVITPEKIVYQGEVDMVIAPGTEGELGVLPLHAPLITKLKHGELRVKIEDKQDYIVIHEGFFQIREDKVIVLVEDAEIASKIDFERARATKEKAEQELAKVLELGIEEDINLAKDVLAKALLRLTAVEKVKKKT